MGMRNKTFTKEEFENAVKKSFSIAQTLKLLGLRVGGANYKMVKRLILEYNLETKHWTGQGHLKGKTHSWAPKRSLKDVLIKKSDYLTSSHLKERLFKEGVKKEKCETCGIENWCDLPISFSLHHINGIVNDNRIENLMILCPNCHSQTNNFAGKGKKKTI